MESDFRSNPKRSWSILKWKSKHRNVPGVISTAAEDGRRISANSSSKIVKLFNQYFALVFTQDADICRPDCVDEVHANPELCDLTFTTNQVQLFCLLSMWTKLLAQTKFQPEHLRKQLARLILHSLHKLLRLGSLPTEWKLANIVPVYKKENKEYIENYPPISLLCLVSKVMERCLFNAIKDQFYILVGSCQHGFMAKRSCVTQLVEVYCLIGSQLDKGGQVDFIFLDFSKAFDKVSHRKLLTLLQEHGFGGNLLAWFDFYLQNRLQRVTALVVSSEALPVTSWVPQGSILGPMLFLFYANSLPDVVKSSRVSTFADDTKIFKTIVTQEDSSLLKANLRNLASWSYSVGPAFNKSKINAKCSGWLESSIL